MNLFKFATWTYGVEKLGDIIRVKAGSTLVYYLKVMKLIVGGNLSLKFVKDLGRIANVLKYIQRTQGSKGLVTYLKVSAVLLQQSAAGHRLDDVSLLGPRVSRTKGMGLPRIIPRRSRIIIANNGPGKHLIIRFYLTIFALYRVLTYAGKLSLNTITDPGVSFNMDVFRKYIKNFIHKFVKDELIYLIPRKLLEMKFRMFTILKSSPQTGKGIWKPLLASNRVRDRKNYWSTHPDCLANSIWSMVNQPYFGHFVEIAGRYAPRLLFVIQSVLNQSAHLPISTVRLPMGKLGLKEEAAGKVRVFAMVDPLTQWLLAPVHKVLFSILRRIPMDGTFNQLKPLYRLLKMAQRRGLPLYSLDLSAATDRLPVSIQAELLDYLFEQVLPKFGSKWQALLTDRYYLISSRKYRVHEEIKYSVGQPMGALSSWAMLALSHHFIVQVAAWEAGYPRTKLFDRYAVLGDDLVLGSRKVKDSYLKILSDIGVKCGLHKSILSPKGVGAEFAKSTFIDGVNVSPVSWLELQTALRDLSAWVAFANKNGLSLVRQFRILGFGYISRRKSFRKLNHACQLVWLAGVAKLDFNTTTLSLVGRLPKDFEAFLDFFKDTVLKPLKSSLIQLARKVEEIDSTAIWEERGLDRNLRHVFHTVYNTTAFSESQLAVKKLWALAEPLTALWEIKTFDQALSIYMQILKDKSIPSLDVFLLRPLITSVGSTKKLPFQVKMFRTWSRISHRLVKRYRDVTKSRNVTQREVS
jgi:hypothetical protein